MAFKNKEFNMTRIILSPSKYIQGENIINELPNLISYLGNNALVIIDKYIYENIPIDFKHSIYCKVEVFSGECCLNEINRLTALANEKSINIIIGIGGGKTIDTAKAVSYTLNASVVISPTTASSDAPTSALSVIYTSEGEFQKYLILRKNPDIVLVDSNIIANAPTRLLVAGIGDALATYFEARINHQHKNITLAGGIPSLAAFTLAKLSYDTMLKHGVSAKMDCDKNQVTSALEDIIEVNTYLSGIGFESSGLAAAHAIHNGFSHLKECHHLLHGEKVAFGTIVQLILEKAPIKELHTVIQFCRKLGLPTTLREMGLKETQYNQLTLVAELACAPHETIHNMKLPITPQDVVDAITQANDISVSLAK